MQSDSFPFFGIVLVAVGMGACGDRDNPLRRGNDASLPQFKGCQTLGFTPSPATGFGSEHAGFEGAAAHHMAEDVIGVPGATLSLRGKFSYGPLGKDFEGGAVTAYLDDCQSWRTVGSVTTDGDGRAQVSLVTTDLGVGVYGLRMVVQADASVAEASLHLLPAGTHLVVFDVDGTLTDGDEEGLQQILAQAVGSDYTPEAYPAAAELTQAWAAKGYTPVYLSGRPYWLADSTRTWLRANGFAPGHVHVTDESGEVTATNEGVGEFKRAYLQALQDTGYVIAHAYGNASTDIYAYAEAGVPTAHTYIIGPNGGDAGTQALADGYQNHLPYVQSQPDAPKTFR